MDRPILVVQTNPVPGREDEFNDWYTNQHLADIISIEGWVAAQRFRVSPVQRDVTPPYPYGYVAVYEMEGDIRANLDRLTATVPTLYVSSAMAEARASHVFEPITDRLTR
jgi:hypothetical protein